MVCRKCPKHTIFISSEVLLPDQVVEIAERSDGPSRTSRYDFSGFLVIRLMSLVSLVEFNLSLILSLAPNSHVNSPRTKFKRRLINCGESAKVTLH